MLRNCTIHNDEICVLFIDDPFTTDQAWLDYLQGLFKNTTPILDAAAGYEKALTGKYDMIIIDFDMPHVNGLELSSRIKEALPEQIIVMVSTYSEHASIMAAIQLGIDGYVTKPFVVEQAERIFTSLCEKITLRHAHKQYEKSLENLVEARTKELKALHVLEAQHYKETLFALVNIIEERDAYTGGHSMRVAKYASRIAKQMGFPSQGVQHVHEAAMLHDIGKTVVPDAILLKPDKLTPTEYLLIQQHVLLGIDILNELPIFKKFIPIVEAHHERIDGSGYPKGLKGDEIPIEAQIIAIADSFDAMTTRRIYKKQLSLDSALHELESLSGIHFDARVVKSALSVFQECNIDQGINQHPKSALEHERFAFFFKDQLTQLFNENYWNFFCEHSVIKNHYTYQSGFTIRHFKAFNSTHGFEKGNACLIQIASFLKTYFPE